MSRRPHRPLLAGVGEHVLVGPAAIRDPIDIGQREARGRARAARAPRLGIERGDDAVGRDAGFDPRRRRRPIAGRQMLFLAIEHQLHRCVGVLREPGADEALAAHAQRLAAETAAHVLANDAHVGLRNAQRGGEILARGVDALRRNPDRQLVPVPLAHGAVRFHARMRDDVRRIGFLDRMRRRLEAGREIARFLRLSLTHVSAGEHRRRRPGQRLLDHRDVRQNLVLDADQPRRVDRVLLGVGGNGCHLVALKHHAVVLRIGRIAPDERGPDARGAPRGRQIDRHDARVWMRGAQDAPVEHPRTIDVEGVFRAAGHFFGAVEPLDGRSKNGAARRPCKFRVGCLRRRCPATLNFQF